MPGVHRKPLGGLLCVRLLLSLSWPFLLLLRTEGIVRAAPLLSSLPVPPRRSLSSDDRMDETPGSRLSHARSRVVEVEDHEERHVFIHSASAAHHHDAEDLGLPFPMETQEERMAKLAKAVRPLSKYPKLNLSDPFVKKFAQLVDKHLAPWKAIEGATLGMGNGNGLVSPRILRAMSNRPDFMSCCAHMKVIKGQLFFRYGGFWEKWYQVRRFALTVKTIEYALREFNLKELTTEFVLNTCDQPISFDSAFGKRRAGYPVFSLEWKEGAVDILYPDPLDLAEAYMSKGVVDVPWAQRKNVGVFRGGTTNYDLHNDTNWRANPRIRLHMLGTVRPDLLDARIMKWSKVDGSIVPSIIADGVTLGRRLERNDLEAYKYEVVADGGGGSSRTCGVISSTRVMIKQHSPYCQFFQPLLKPYVHYVPTEHHFEDIYHQVEWLQRNDEAAKNMRRRAHVVACRACTWKGRALYWAILLVKYTHEALESAAEVKAPTEASVCRHKFREGDILPWENEDDKNSRNPRGWPPVCSAEVESVGQPPCTFFCFRGTLKEKPHVWVTADSLNTILVEGLR